tara:strand:- start:20 stop:475 length:456 start_codon:yes stop_codon:yes gene_type:complete
MKTRYSGTILGLLFTLFSLAATQTFILPLLTIIPIGVPLESLFAGEDYLFTAIKVVSTLIFLFLISSFWLIKNLESDLKEGLPFNNIRLAIYLGLQLIIIHPLGFFSWAMVHPESAGDGQFVFGIMGTFPFSSIPFVILGIAIDFVKNRKE